MMKAYKRLSILCIAVLLCALLPVLAGATSPEDPPEAVDPNAVYVSVGGNDATGAGSQGAPYATLAKAVEVADDGATIYVMSNLEMTECARYYGKDLTITSGEGGPYTVTRSDEFDILPDTARSWYNPAMIEVGSTEGRGTASLTLTNITFDDDGKKEGEYFIQADSEGDGETVFGKETIGHGKIVQDAIIATYNGTGTITLGEGTVLKNYGGMSAVRLSDGELVMKSGSVIMDDEDLPARTKGTAIQGAETGLYGPAGAVWMQGGTIIMEEGSEITDIDGRAIYNEAGNATINGTIAGIKPNSAMWQGTGGVVMHMRVNAIATFSPTAVIDGKGVTLKGSGIGVLGGCKLTMEEGSLIKNYNAGNVLDIGGEAYLNGEITGLTGGGHAIVCQNWDTDGTHYIRIGKSGYIHDNVCAYGVIYLQGASGVIDIYGKINDNISTDRGGALVLANNGTHVDAYMYDGAEMCRNVSYQTGGAVMVSCGTFTMKGGTISDNISGAGNVGEEDKVGGGVYVRRGGQFIMNGGTIADNFAAGAGGNLSVSTETYNSVPDTTYGPAYVQLNGGTISGGTMNAEVTQAEDGSYTATGGQTNDLSVTSDVYGKITNYLTVSENATIGNSDVYMQKYDFTLLDPQRGTKLGNAATACETAVTSEYGSQPLYLSVVKGSFWYQSEEDLVLRLSGLQYDTAKPLLVSIVETKADGTPAEEAEPTLQAVSSDEDGVISLPLSGNENGYAVVFVQEQDASGIITVVPANLTAYMGGNGGYESVVDENGNVVEEGSSSLPRPIFKVAGPENVALGSLTFKNEESGNAWKLVPASEGSSYYRFEKVQGDKEVRVQYDDGDGPVTEDHFTPASECDVFKEYTVTIYSGNTSGDNVEAGNGGKHYTVITGAGILTVRAVNNEQDEAVTKIQESVTTPTSGSAVAVEPEGGTTYTLNNTDVQLPADAVPSLLFDDIIENEGSTDRTDALKAKADKKIGSESENRQYEIKYLDLVDANNGNAWITSRNGIDIYWAYPAGTSSSTEFTLLHFKGLHRDGANSGYNVSDINSVDPEEVTIEKTANGIKFHVKSGSFSPFALVWEEAAVTPPVTPSEPADPDDTGVSDLLDTENHNQYLFGYPEGTFGPDQNMTRAEVAQMFYNLLVDKNVAITASFEDVPADAWYAKSVNTLASMGIISGVGENRFEPERSITRAEFTSMAMKFTKGALDGTNVFSDVHSGDWFYEAVVGSIQYGWIEGYEDGTFRPENRITRVEVTSIVNKMLGRFADREFVAGHADELNAFSDVTSTHWGYYHIVEATNSHTYTKPSTNVETWTELK